MRVAALRRALLPVVVAATAVLGGASVAGAQVIGAGYAPGCGPSTACSLLRFSIGNYGSSPLVLNTLTLTSTNAAFRFAPLAGGSSLYQAADSFGGFGGSGTVSAGGTQLFIDFLGGSGFAFELNGLSTGYVELALTATPAYTNGSFTFSANLASGGTIGGAVSTVPEPTTVALLGGGLALVGLVARRRRHA
jgi:hypothetical protein